MARGIESGNTSVTGIFEVINSGRYTGIRRALGGSDYDMTLPNSLPLDTRILAMHNTGNVSYFGIGNQPNFIPQLDENGEIDESIIPPTIPRFTWNMATENGAIAPNNGYLANSASRVILTLPTSSALLSMIEVGGLGAGGWRIAQNANQRIHILNDVTTVGTAGYLETENTISFSNKAYIRLICVVPNTEWLALDFTGRLEVV